MDGSVISVVPEGPMELAVLWNVSVWRRTPWIAVPRMVVAPANLVTKATGARKSAHQARMGKTVTRYVSVQQRTKTVIQSLEDVPVCLATMGTTASSGAQKTLMVQTAKNHVSA